MTVWLVIALVVMTLLAGFFGLATYRLFAQVEADGRIWDDPAYMALMLKGMLKTVEERQDWSTLEAARWELKRALQKLDKMRHDTSATELRGTKPPHP